VQSEAGFAGDCLASSRIDNFVSDALGAIQNLE